MTDNRISYNLDYLKEISNNDEDFMIDMLKTFIDITPSSLNNIDHFLEIKDYQQLARATHKFAPSLSFLGVEKIHHDIDLLEEYAQNETNVDEIPGLVNEIKNTCQLIIQDIEKKYNL